ncbi:Protein of unknown function [Cotesia congregata]|uniref:Uncharacterized protein n=1 Tax=Cotesia congregata TaxID=51543 RepID=A0A8J2EDX1_COTCN|nr:Protein of unknown function [Cotesia congregata]
MNKAIKPIADALKRNKNLINLVIKPAISNSLKVSWINRVNDLIDSVWWSMLYATREKADSCPSADEDEAADGGLPKRLHENTAHAASHAAHHHDALVTLAQDSKPGSSAPRLN